MCRDNLDDTVDVRYKQKLRVSLLNAQKHNACNCCRVACLLKDYLAGSLAGLIEYVFIHSPLVSRILQVVSVRKKSISADIVLSLCVHICLALQQLGCHSLVLVVSTRVQRGPAL